MMTQLDFFIERIKSNSEIKNTSFEVDETPIEFFEPEDAIEFHASRLLFLLKFCSTDKLDNGEHSIKGRTKLAKLDFFLRYPVYLEKILEKLKKGHLILKEHEKQNIETRMIRYKYGPWDDKYYDVWAYLLAKGLIVIKPINGIDYFLITEQGKAAVDSLLGLETYNVIKKRCQVIKKSLAKRKGTSLKNLIYQHFPEIVGQPIGSTINGVYDA